MSNFIVVQLNNEDATAGWHMTALTSSRSPSLPTKSCQNLCEAELYRCDDELRKVHTLPNSFKTTLINQADVPKKWQVTAKDIKTTRENLSKNSPWTDTNCDKSVIRRVFLKNRRHPIYSSNGAKHEKWNETNTFAWHFVFLLWFKLPCCWDIPLPRMGPSATSGLSNFCKIVHQMKLDLAKGMASGMDSGTEFYFATRFLWMLDHAHQMVCTAKTEYCILCLFCSNQVVLGVAGSPTQKPSHFEPSYRNLTQKVCRFCHVNCLTVIGVRLSVKKKAPDLQTGISLMATVHGNRYQR